MKTEILSRPYRFFGPVSAHEAENIAERMLDEPTVKDIFLRFLRGDIEPNGLCYELQVAAENTEAELARKEFA